MTNFTDAADAIRARLALNATGFPISYGNDDFQPERDGGENGWIYVKIGTMSGQQVSLGDAGNRDFRDNAQAHIWVYVPRGTLVGVAEAHAEAIRDLFLSEHFAATNLDFTNRYIGESGKDGTDGRWWGVPVVLAFTYDRIG